MTKPRCSVEGGSRRGSSALGGDRRRRGIGRTAREQGAVDQPTRQVDRDEIEHQRRDDFVDPEPRAQQPGPEQPEAADQPPRRERRAESGARRPVGEREAEHGGDHPAKIEAAFRADIEDARRETPPPPRGRSAAAASPPSESRRCAARRRKPLTPSIGRPPSGSCPVAASTTRADRERERERRRGGCGARQRTGATRRPSRRLLTEHQPPDLLDARLGRGCSSPVIRPP